MQPEWYKHVMDNLFEGVYYVDLQKTITYWSKGAERITGYSAEEVVGACCADNILRHIDDDGNELCHVGCPLGAVIKDHFIRDAHIFLHHKKGHRVPVRVRVIPITDESGNISGAVEIFQDISKRSDLIKELENLKKETLHDDLTGIGNRRLADLAIQEGMSYLIKDKAPFGVVFLDIDHFKNINDTYGHNFGDKVLVMVAKTLSNLSRPLDTVARWGGEEFIVIAPNVNREILEKISERIRSFIEKTWLMIDGTKVMVTVSVGTTLAKAREDEEELVRRVDSLMYQSKKAGRNRISVG